MGNGVGFWNTMPTVGANQRDILLRVQDALAVEEDLAFGALLWVQLEHAIEGAQQGRFAAARRTDDRGDLVLRGCRG